MTVKITVLAKVDGDELARAFKLPGCADAEIGLIFEIEYKQCTVTCESIEDALAFLKAVSTEKPKTAASASNESAT